MRTGQKLSIVEQSPLQIAPSIITAVTTRRTFATLYLLKSQTLIKVNGTEFTILIMIDRLTKKTEFSPNDRATSIASGVIVEKIKFPMVWPKVTARRTIHLLVSPLYSICLSLGGPSVLKLESVSVTDNRGDFMFFFD